jgi:hypothetical protein
MGTASETSSHPAIANADPLNFTAVRLRSYYNDLHLSDATGFFYAGTLDGEPNIWLATNWHVLAGRNADKPHQALHTDGCIPNRLRLNLILKRNQPEYDTALPGALLFQEQFIELYEPNGQASWTQHAEGAVFDVGIVNLKGLVGRFEMPGINHTARENDMSIQLGNQIFILGYPLGYTHFIETPIWKHGIISSEPNLETPEGKNRVVIDATTRQGMSGAPVIMREKTHYLSEKGSIVSHPNATRFVGIYASRPDIPQGNLFDAARAEIGFFYKSGCVHDAIVGGGRGPHYGELP